MNQHGASTTCLRTWTRVTIAALTATAVGVTVSTSGVNQVVHAADVAPPTAFEIDGNRTGTYDFASPYGAGTTPGGYPTTGLYYDQQTIDEGGATGCDLANDTTAAGGVKLGDGPIWLTGGPNPNGKTDLDFIDLAAEKVDKDGQIFDILYVGYQKCGGTGTWQTALYLDDGDGVTPSQGDDDGDYLFVFDFNPSSGAVNFIQYRRTAGEWVLSTTDDVFIEGQAAGDYGEVALNITELVFTDAQGVESCSAVAASGPAAAITGGDLSSQVKDLLAFPPLVIDNCGALAVTKAGPTGADVLFGYDVTRTGGGQVHDDQLGVTGIVAPASTTEPDADLTELDATIEIGQTHTWDGLLGANDYDLTETLPDPAGGWAIDTITCSYQDVFRTGYPTVDVTLYEDGAPTGAEFAVPPDSIGGTALDPTSCVITNAATGIVVAKQTLPDGAATEFPFTVSSPAGDTRFDLADGGSRFVALADGTEVTITEGAVADSPSWNLTDVTCRNQDGTAATVTGETDDSVTLDVGALGNTITCSFTNTQDGRLVIDKTGSGVDADTADFSFDVSGTTVGPIRIGGSTGPIELAPGRYDVSELLPVTGASGYDFVLSSVTCDSTVGSITNGATVAVDPGATVTCTFDNDQRGPVTVTKSAELLAPAPVAGTIDRYDVRYTVTATSASNVAEQITVDDAFGFPATVTPVGTPTVTGPGQPSTWNGDDQTTLYSGSIAAGGQLVWTIDTTVELDLQAPSTDRVCDGDPGSGAFNGVTLTVTDGGRSSDDACVDLPDPDISVTKTAVADPTQPEYQGGDAFTVDYEIVVTNTGDGPGSYTLVEAPDFGAGIDVTGISATSTDGTVDPAFALGSLTLADDVGLAAGDSHTYTVTVAFTIAGDATLGARDCAGPGTATYNSVTLRYNGVDGGRDDACVDLPDPDITIDKAVSDGQPVHVADDVYTAEYTITVDNVGDGPGAYDLVDTPDFGTGATITNVAVTGNGVDIDREGGAPVTIATGVPIDPDEAAHVYTVTVTFRVAGSMTTEARTCATGEERAGSGAYNGATVTSNGGTIARDDDCVDIPEPDVSIIKSLDTANPLTRNADGTWTLGYLLSVSNAAAAGPGDYDLADTFDFPTGVTVDDVQATIVGTDPAADVLVPGFDGAAQPVVASAVRIDDGETHVYRVLLDLTIDVVPGLDGDCAGDGGLRNTMSVAVRGGEPITDEACASFSTLTLVKRVVSNDGGEASLGDFTLTATGPVTISGTSPVASAVPAGTYTLTETQVEGYALTSLTCDDTDGQVGAATVDPGEDVICTFVNDDRPVDLRVTKDDGGVTAIAGGDPFDYTITVSNVGSRDADLGEPVTVTDELPTPLAWVSYPDGCTRDGQTLTCDIDPALMTVGGDPVVLVASVRAPADTPSGTYTNHVSVTTQDDPVCQGEACTPPPCELAANTNNVDCEDTPVDRQGAIRIVKTDDVANGDSVTAGDTYSYSLVVTNTGASTILPGAVVTDDLPAKLDLVSVAGGSDWTCNDADPIECTYAPSLAPGATAPTITVEVRVRLSASGTSIPNTAAVIGAVDRECAATAPLAEAFVPACNQVSDRDDESTPLIAEADLAIEKSAEVAITGLDGSFDWTLVVTNEGPGTAVDVVVGDLVPDSLTVDAVSSSFFDCSRSGNDVTCTRPSMAVGASGTITISVTVDASAADGTIVNVGTVESATPDPDLTNNSDDASVDLVVPLPPTTVTPQLPATGSDSTRPLARTALWLVLLGGIVVLTTRRRRDAMQR